MIGKKSGGKLKENQMYGRLKQAQAGDKGYDFRRRFCSN